MELTEMSAILKIEFGLMSSYLEQPSGVTYNLEN